MGAAIRRDTMPARSLNDVFGEEKETRMTGRATSSEPGLAQETVVSGERSSELDRCTVAAAAREVGGLPLGFVTNINGTAVDKQFD
jgi:hypothetical protein